MNDQNTRDIAGDYLNALIREHKAYVDGGEAARADDVAGVLRELGHEVDKAPAGAKERAVDTEPLETAVEADVAPKRRGRPPKNAE
ncbi:hypothetical protein [Mycobacterium phage WXIN]|nr:hypothetical protein [Mycobacterium phage WXIN]